MGTLHVFAASDVCRIGSTGYADLQSAFDAVKEGEVIIMQSNITITDGAEYETKNAVNFTLDLNGKTINGGSGNWHFITHKAAGTLTIQDSGSYGKITSKRSDRATVSIGNSSSDVKLILKSGTIENTGDVGYAIMHFGGTLHIEGGKVYGTSCGVSKRGGDLTLSGGVIDGGASGIGTYGGSSTITITGGSPVIKGGTSAVFLIQIFTYSNAKIMASKTSTNGSALEEVRYSDLESYDITNKIEIYKYITTEPMTRVTLKQGETGTETAYYDFPKAWREALTFAENSSTREHQAILTLQQDITGVSSLWDFKQGYITLDTNGKRLSFGSASSNPWEDIGISGGELSIIGSGTVEGTSTHSTIYINSGVLNLTDATIRNIGGTNFTIKNGGFTGNGPGVFNMFSGTIENVTGITPLSAAGKVSNIYSGMIIGPVWTSSYTKLNLLPEAGKPLNFVCLMTFRAVEYLALLQ
jgi:hypothetical protein